METHLEVFFDEASAKSSAGFRKAQRNRARAAGVALSSQKVRLTPSLTSVHLKA